MGFINNHSDPFLQSNSPWGDDNITMYNVPKQNRIEPELRPEDLGYEQLSELILQFSQLMPSLNSEDALRIGGKLSRLQNEKQQRDQLEDVTRTERDDAFEQKNTIVKEDVPEAKAAVKPKTITPKITIITPPIVDTVTDTKTDIDDELLDLELDDLLDQNNNPNIQVAGIDNTDNFLLASMIIIAVILITK